MKARASLRLRDRFLWVALVVWAALTAGPLVRAASTDNDSWIDRLEEIISQPRYQSARWGILVADLATGEILFQRDADKLFTPASTTKLFSVAAALDALGADSRFETIVYARGQAAGDSQWRGDLILRASGDLTLGGRTDRYGRIAFQDSDHTYANGNRSARWTEPGPCAGLDELARQVAAAGIKQVQGEVLIDDRLFEPAESTGSGPSRLTPILVNDNLVDILITPASPGSPAAVRWRPESAALSVDAQVSTVENAAELKVTVQALGSNQIIVRGQIPAGHQPLLRVCEVDDPVSFARSLLVEALRRAGVAVDASPLGRNRPDLLPPAKDYADLKRVAVYHSPPFREEMKLILKVSHNLHASTLPLLLAARNAKRTLSEGLRIQRDHLARLGVAVDTLSFAGGAGGARADSVTPRTTVQLLRAMAERPDFSAYKSALPVLGIDGTLTRAVAPDSPARGKVFAKTGTLFYDNLLNDRFLLTSKALAGYLTTRCNRELAFAMFLNNAHLEQADDTAREGRVLGELCEVIYEAP